MESPKCNKDKCKVSKLCPKCKQEMLFITEFEPTGQWGLPDQFWECTVCGWHVDMNVKGGDVK